MSKRKIVSLLLFILFCLVALVMIAPMIWALSVSLQESGRAYEIPPRLFVPPYKFENYAIVFKKYDFLKYFLNTLTICALSIVGTVFSSAMIGFGFAKYDSKGMRALFFIGLCTMYVPTITMLVPRYVIWSKLGALDSFIPLVLPSFFGTIMWIFMMRQCFKSIPNALFEAAYIDGANPFYIMIRIYMPLATPITATIILREFMAKWSDLMEPLIYITSKSKYTVALALSSLRMETQGRLELEMAGAVLAMAPVILVYLIAQKYFVEGITSAGVKY